jgi:ABC-type polysaccharide/polyol phosphate export permease
MLNGIILLIAIGTGLLVHFFSKNKNVGEADGFVLHDEEVCHCFVKKAIIPQLRMISFERTLLLLFTIVFIVFLISGNIGPANWNWKSYTFLFSSLFLLFVFATVPDHFLSEHLYKHIINVSSM